MGEPKEAGVERSRATRLSRELQIELRRAERDFDRGDFLDMTAEQLERCLSTGEDPWANESRD